MLRDSDSLLIGGAPAVHLRRPLDSTDRPQFLSATFLPGRGMNLLQLRAFLPELGEIDVLRSPPLDEAQHLLNGKGKDVMGNGSFALGGAFLVPFANRIRGALLPDGASIETNILGRSVRLPANWQGKNPGAEKHAIHGLILAERMDVIEASDIHIAATLDAGDFRGHWLSRSFVRIESTLGDTTLDLQVTVKNVGHDMLPVGIGWHPYFAIPSGKREQARLHIPARQRVLVNNYDDVFPTGTLASVNRTGYDLNDAEGSPLGSQFLDDTFFDFQKTAEGKTVFHILDPAANYELRIIAEVPEIRAAQVYALPGQPFVALEPQFNLGDPFSQLWPRGTDTGMVQLMPGMTAQWGGRIEIRAIARGE